MAAAAVNSSSGTQKVCFNSNCKAVLERVNKGWRRRTGEFAELCDRCSSVYEAGNFCETFHLNSSGWRCCESCGKQIHCGCIVSFHMFVLLDPGGIECLTCARKSFILTPNPAWPTPSLFLPVQPERIKEISTRNWPAIVGSGPVPWRQAPSVFNATSVQSDLQSRMPIEVDRHRFHERLSSPPIEKRKMEESLDRLMNGSLKISCSGVIGGGATVVKSVEQPTSSLNHFQQTANSKTLGSTSALVSISKPETENHHPMVAGTTAPRPTVVYPQAEKRSSGKNQADVSQTEKRSSSQNQADISQTERRSSGQNQADISQTEKRSSGQNQADISQTEKRSCGQNQADVSEAQPCNGKARGGDVRGRGQLLPRYWPRISEEELQKISQHSNSVITPLFEKMLSASDAGRIGRLVLPKKCAEAYFPPISQPEGVPLKIQDLKGQEWVFQFRFWPNNNSRMYVLEGIMPCIQSMQLQAGDIVTFSRIEPEGKLVMGCRKAFTEKGNETSQKPPSNVEGVDKGKKVGELGPTMQVDATSPPSLQPPPSQQTTEPAVNTLYEADKHGVDVGKANTPVHGKRKNSTVGLKRKRLRIDSEDAFELKVSWDQVQGLLRPSTDKVATVCVVEGCEFEEFEEGAPVIGRPTIPESDHHGKKVQWVQCEKCLKWRKVPTDVLLISQWTCSDNMWDPPRSRCSAEEELTAEKLETLLTTTSNGPSEKTKKDPTPDPEILEAIEGLDALAELAVQEKSASLSLLSSSQQPPTSSKHPRHKPGCSCIVCIQPPSGKGPKHKQPCDCVVCKSVKRRFETLMLKREQKLSSSEKEPEPELGPESGGQSSEIDLNIQPHKDDRLGKGIITVMKKEMQRMSKTSPENIENSGEDRRLAGGVIMNKEMQQTPKMSPENIENSGEDRLVGGIIMNKEMLQTPKMSPENIEISGEDRLAGGIITSKEMQTTPKMSPENTENSGAGVTTKEMPQRLPEYTNGIGHNNGDISSPSGIVASVTPAD